MIRAPAAVVRNIKIATEKTHKASISYRPIECSMGRFCFFEEIIDYRALKHLTVEEICLYIE